MVNFPVKAKKPNEISVMGYRVFSDRLNRIPIRSQKPRTVNTISPNSYGLAAKNPSLEWALGSSDYLVLDGVYFALASLLLRGKNICRNQGPDVFHHFMERLNQMGGSAFFLGSSQATLYLIKRNAAIRYPHVKVFTYPPPFVAEFSKQDDEKMINAINQVRPDIVFIGMTCPKQEIWAVRNVNRLQTGLVIGIGNVFDWFAGTQRSIHPVWFTLRLGWLVRIFLRPEIFRRNIGNQLIFFYHLLLVFIGLKPEPAFVTSKN